METNRKQDTIAAIATAVGEGGVGVIRISGSHSLEIIEKIFRPTFYHPEWISHKMVLGEIVSESEEMMDEVLCVWMQEGKSFTGEDVVEIHAHGGKLNLLQLLRRVLSFQSLVRSAEAGEFSKRAFLNGKMDLTKVEAIASLISAKNEQALQVSRSHLKGGLSSLVQKISDDLLYFSAQVESWIDFPEEFDPALDRSIALLFENLRLLLQPLQQLKNSYSVGQKINEGATYLLLGKPNAGKSSVFNRLVGKEKAIVTDLPGTTRDLLESTVFLGSSQFSLMDSAGVKISLFQESQDSALLSSHDKIEKEGISRAIQAVQQTDLLLIVMDLSREWNEEDDEILLLSKGKECVLLLNKMDLPQKLDPEKWKQFQSLQQFKISCSSQEGMDLLLSWLQDFNRERFPVDEILLTNERQYLATKDACFSLEKALQEGASLGPEFMAEDVRTARRHLAEITGVISSEEILGKIFSSFCIGK